MSWYLHRYESSNMYYIRIDRFSRYIISIYNNFLIKKSLCNWRLYIHMGEGSGLVRLLVGNRGWGQVNILPGWVRSGPRKVTRGQLRGLNLPNTWSSVYRSCTSHAEGTVASASRSEPVIWSHCNVIKSSFVTNQSRRRILHSHEIDRFTNYYNCLARTGKHTIEMK